MSLKNRSLVSSDSKRAAKTVSCMRNGKMAFASSAGSNANSGSSAASTAAKVAENTTSSSATEDDEKKEMANVALKEEPKDEEDCDYYEEGILQSSSSSGGYPMTLTRVRSHSRSLRAMANPSAVWAHFDLCSNDPLRAQCRICGAVVVRGGANPRQCGTTNLHRHLRVHHGGRLVGRRYQALSRSESLNAHDGNIAVACSRESDSGLHPTTKALRLATQNLVRQMRNIAPAPSSQQQPRQVQPQQQQQQPQQQQPQQQQSQPQGQPPQLQRPTKTLVLKTIPLKMKPIASNAIKMPTVRQAVQTLQQNRPQTVLPQQPTEVCLRWNSYHSNMQHSFPSLLDAEQFVDVTLACEGRSLKCHKMILSSCSDYLAQLLRENPCQHPIILMKDLKFWEVEALVKFMYRGEVNVAHDKLPQLLNAAEALQVKGLAGPSQTQHPMPPLLIPQMKSPPKILSRIPNETKENKPSTSTSNTATTSTPIAKRGQKRRTNPSEVPEARPFTKIRLQRPASPIIQRRQETSSPTVKAEPLEIPLSPGDNVLYEHGFQMQDDDSCSNADTYDNLVIHHEEDDPGGEEIELADNGSDLGDDDATNNYAEEQMEFVPTDFLEQEQEIVEDSEDQTNCSNTQYTDDDSKQNNEDEDEEDQEEEEEEEIKSDEESKSDRTKTKKDKT